MTNEEFGKLLAEEIEKEYVNEINELWQEAEKAEVQIPKELEQRLEKQLWKEDSKKSNRSLRWKVASFFITFTIISAGICIAKPEVVTAIREVFRVISAKDTSESVDFIVNHTLSGLWKQIEQTVPKDFAITDAVSSRNMERLRFETEKEYIELTLYDEDYMLSLDNENFNEYQELEINACQSKLIEKNEITTIVFLYHSRLLELESNLPKEDILNTAEGILKNE